jgi:hypothetical protein
MSLKQVVRKINGAAAWQAAKPTIASEEPASQNITASASAIATGVDQTATPAASDLAPAKSSWLPSDREMVILCLCVFLAITVAQHINWVVGAAILLVAIPPLNGIIARYWPKSTRQ